jgi:purine operon repressor
MEKARKMERIVALTKILTERPNRLFPLGYFSERFDAAKSTLSEDMLLVRQILQKYNLGTLETVTGAAGGVRYVPCPSSAAVRGLLQELAFRLSAPERIIPGGFLYMSDILYAAHQMVKVGEIFFNRFRDLAPDYIMTVETKGIPLGLMTAQAFDLPLVTVRRGSRVTEGSTVSINYVSGSSHRIQTMSLPRRALPSEARVLIIDDFMKAGGTALGMVDLAHEFGAAVIGIGVLVATAKPDPKLIADYQALLILHAVDEHTKVIDIRPVCLA